MRIQFIGAAHEVTGSCTLLQVCGKYYLVDCGMEQGRDVFQNIDLPVAPGMIEAVFLTHAHIDHSGMLPKLYKDGFRGLIYTTEATADLCRIMLMDSAHIQESEAKWQARRAERSGDPAPEPAYTTLDAQGTLRLFRPCAYGQRLTVGEGVELRLTDVGHMLGSAAVELWLTEQGQTRKIVFSGDVGNTDRPLLRDPQFVESADYLVLESTYGNRNHALRHREDTARQLADVIQETLDRGGNLVIPSFAVGRTQEMLYLIREIKEKGLVTGHPGFPVYVDSPLAVEATGIYLQCDPSFLDEETREVVQRGINPIWFDGIRLSVTAEESRNINTDMEPKVILSASGMCEAGRVRHHLKYNLWRQESSVLFVGYQAEGSLGRLLQDGAEEIKLFGERIMVQARIATLQGTSGHADQAGLLRWLRGFREKPRMVFVNHGDQDACEAFRDLLLDDGYRADAPYSGAMFDLITGRALELPEGQPVVKKTKTGKTATTAGLVYSELLSAATELLELARSYKGHANKEIRKFTDQIRTLMARWK